MRLEFLRMRCFSWLIPPVKVVIYHKFISLLLDLFRKGREQLEIRGST